MHLAVLHAAPPQAVFRTAPVGAGEWLPVLAVGPSVIGGGELDEWRSRR